MNTRALNEKRNSLVNEMRALTVAPAGAAGDLSDEQSRRFDALKADLEKTEKNLARQQTIDDAERRMAGAPLNSTGDNRLDQACQSFSLRAAIASAAGLNVDASREKEVSAELARRSGRQFQGIAVPASVFHVRNVTSQFASPDSGGANLVTTDQRPDLYIDALRANMAVRKLGARILTGLQGNIEIPKLSASANSSWIADDSALSPSDPTFTKLTLQPNTCGAMTEFSRNLLLQSSPEVEQLLRADFAGVLAGALDIAAISGAGGNEPIGILNTSGVDKTTVSGAVTWAKVLQLIELVEAANAQGNGWCTTPSVVRLLRSTPKVSSTDSVMIQQEPRSLAGYRLEPTSNVTQVLGSPPTDHALIFGDWSDLIIGMWSELDILVNPYETGAYSRGGVKVRALMTVDVGVRHAASFAAMTLDP